MFTPIYYLCIACPTVERTLEMVDQYVKHGAFAFQIDMPSRNPFAETDFVKSMMKEAMSSVPDYDMYMDGLREIRRRHPDLELHTVVYNDVVDAIGTERFSAFSKEIGAASLMIPGASAENLLFLELEGFKVFRTIPHELPEVRIRLAQAVGSHGIISLRNRKPGERDRPGLETFERKYRYIVQERGVCSPVYSVFGIQTPEELAEIKKTGARGAIIGNVLMRLWEDKQACLTLLEKFQALAER